MKKLIFDSKKRKKEEMIVFISELKSVCEEGWGIISFDKKDYFGRDNLFISFSDEDNRSNGNTYLEVREMNTGDIDDIILVFISLGYLLKRGDTYSSVEEKTLLPEEEIFKKYLSLLNKRDIFDKI